MTKADVDAWLTRYIAAWQSYDPNQITALFTDDVEYRYQPWDEPVVGSETIAKSWVEAERKDEPDSWEADYSCIAIDGDVAVATGYSKYLTPEGTIRTIYDNCFVMRFAADGRCASFTEFYMERPDQVS
jgi:ketosteroid isomerase-like protein